MKNIILFSDGTGNGAAKRNKTNVWRLYDALDLHQDRQIAMYDDGVGSRESTYNKVMGGAFGYGLSRNVIELYKYLCRNYKDDDRIYLFGFSRGAFTVRVLAGFVTFAGLYTDYKDEADLHAQALCNYRYYRDRYKHGYLSRLLKRLFGCRGKLTSTVKPKIEFIGVWDTVDAYVFPMDELAIIWDLLIYPIRFPDSRLHKDVRRACHAVSVDDERHTFHPVMWDEEGESGKRIEQVWFPGVHADVGGGYPRRSLSLLALDWMISRVEADSAEDGLVFIGALREQYKSRSDWNGPQHDSRAGLAAYYRYKPRDIARICNDAEAGVRISRPKIHRSVLERIRGRAMPYAPVGIPAEYEVAVTEGSAKQYETTAEAEKRSAALNYARDMIFWRRLLYFSLLLATLALVSSRFFLDWQEDGVCRASACWIDPVVQLVIDSLPGFAAGWFQALRQNPWWLWFFAGLFTALFILRSLALAATQQRAMRAWAKLRRGQEVPPWEPTLISWLRDIVQYSVARFSGWLLALLIFVLILYLLFALLNGGAFYLRDVDGRLCQPSAASRPLSGERTLRLDIGNACYATGIQLEAGKTYHLYVSDDVVYDGDGNAATADGLKSPGTIMYLFIPLRRHVTEPWIRLFGRTGNSGNEKFALSVGENRYTASTDGELFLYVNDAVFGLLPEWDLPYHWERGKNSGEIAVTVFEQEPLRHKQ